MSRWGQMVYFIRRNLDIKYKQVGEGNGIDSQDTYVFSQDLNYAKTSTEKLGKFLQQQQGIKIEKTEKSIEIEQEEPELSEGSYDDEDLADATDISVHQGKI